MCTCSVVPIHTSSTTPALQLGKDGWRASQLVLLLQRTPCYFLFLSGCSCYRHSRELQGTPLACVLVADLYSFQGHLTQVKVVRPQHFGRTMKFLYRHRAGRERAQTDRQTEKSNLRSSLITKPFLEKCQRHQWGHSAGI